MGSPNFARPPRTTGVSGPDWFQKFWQGNFDPYLRIFDILSDNMDGKMSRGTLEAVLGPAELWKLIYTRLYMKL